LAGFAPTGQKQLKISEKLRRAGLIISGRSAGVSA
jgi:hypothetical protein